MQYMVVFQPARRFQAQGKPADFDRQEREEQLQTRRLHADGSVRQVWALVEPQRGAVVLFEADSANHLTALIDSFPLIQVHYAEYQTFPLAPHPALGSG